VNGLEPTALLNQELDLMPTQEKQKPFYPKTESIIRLPDKMWISNAGFCSLFIVFARIGDDKNITGFIIENDADNGISMGEEHKLGIRASSTRQVFFNETKVSVENMLSERGNGFKIAMNALNVGRIKLAAACLDAQRRVISNSVKYANERVQLIRLLQSLELSVLN
jgi:alkylation response protein AidB-like acyl-CoA dehydrogenase